MRSFLTAFLIFFITGSCFATKTERSRPVYCSAKKENRTTLLSRFLAKTHSSKNDSLSKDEFEQPKLSRQFLKKQQISCLQLFHIAEGTLPHHTAVQPYLASADLNSNFIYLFLYPKHVFW